jgi:geranylgeranyl pyrophosphate synthase/uncharacterized protein with NAD-binding domain and iron-sulfur cluster
MAVPRVVVMGGGVAGLSAAHELGERGFDVVVLERRHNPGGKARSMEVEPTRLGPNPHRTLPRESAHAWAPGEHGFRFFPGFYRHVIDTMARTPTRASGTVADHLVPTSRVGITQYGRPVLEFPSRFPRKPNDALSVLQAILMAFSPVAELLPAELAHFAARIWQILTSCPERRLAEYEKVPWWTFIGAESRSLTYQKFLASGITRSLVAAKARTASTRTIGDIFVQLILTIVDPLAGATDRVLDGPTSHVWIDDWVRWITSLGVELRTGVTITGLRCDRERITGVLIDDSGRAEVVTGDHYVCALPVERTAPLLTAPVLDADPHLAEIEDLAANVEWMNGIQFYLRRPVPILHGHVIHIDSEWALTTVSQMQFWRHDALDHYLGQHEVKDILSVDVSDWEAPGINGRPAVACTREQVVTEVWDQLRRSMHDSGVDQLEESDRLAWFLDPDIRPDPISPGRLTNLEPLLVNLEDTWRLRPDAVTAIPNFFLASDYVRTYTDLATMEAANEAARRAVNGILDATGYPGGRCSLWPLEEPTVLAPWRDYDAARFKLGLPWDAALVDMAATGLQISDPVLGAVPALLSGAGPFVSAIEHAKLTVDEVQHAVGLGHAEEALIQPLDERRLQSPLWLSGSAPVAHPSLVSHLSAPATRDDPVPVTGVVPEIDLAPGPRPADGSPASGDGVGAPDRVRPTADDGPVGFVERLDWYHQMIADTLDGAVPDAEPRRYLYGPMREFIARPAKGLRPGLCLATCRSFGGSTEDALASAAGLELLHHAFLVHDDIEDGSLSRRGGDTLHRQLGTPVAINVGDALNARAMRLFRSNVDRLGPARALAILEEVDHLVAESLEGQAIELGWVRDNDCTVGVDDYLRMVLKKTAWYSFIHPMRIGSIVAGVDDDLDRFNRLGFLLGAAFQIQDDVLNLTGTLARYGKEIGGDLWEGKRTLVLSHALSHAGPTERGLLEGFLARPRHRRLPREIAVVHDVLDETGAIEFARGAASALIEAAHAELARAYAEAQHGADLGFVRSLVGFLVARDT